MLMNALDAFAEMPTQMASRSIFMKQTSYRLFRPGALSLANTIADIPFSTVRILLYNIIAYFMTGLYRNGGAFWTFHLLIYTAFLTMQGMRLDCPHRLRHILNAIRTGFFRTIGVLCPSFDSAFRLAALLVPNMVLYAGYIIPRKSMHKYIFWFYWLNPMQYAFSGLLENEFGRLDMSCDTNYITPRNAPGQSNYPDDLGPNQVCTFFGSQPANPIVSGKAYIDVAYGIKANQLWKLNFVVLVGMFIFFQITQAFAMETASVSLHHPSWNA